MTACHVTQGIRELDRTFDIKKTKTNLYLDGDRYHLLKFQPHLLFPLMHSLIFPVILTFLLHLLTCMVISNSHLPCQNFGNFSTIFLGRLLHFATTANSYFLFVASFKISVHHHFMAYESCMFLLSLLIAETKTAELWFTLSYSSLLHLWSLSPQV